MADVPALVGTVPGWISAGGIVGLLTLLVRFVLGNKKLDNDAAEQIRVHYDAQIKLLWDQLNQTREDSDRRIIAIREEYERQIKVIRTEHDTQTKDMKAEIDGLRKQLLAYEAAAMRNLPEGMLTNEMQSALRSLEKLA